MKNKAQKIGSAVFTAALLAFFYQLYHRVAVILASTPPQKTPAKPPGSGEPRASAAEKPAAALVAGEKKIKTAFIDCNGIYN